MQKLKKLGVLTLTGFSILPLLSLSCARQKSGLKQQPVQESFSSDPVFRASDRIGDSFHIKNNLEGLSDSRKSNGKKPGKVERKALSFVTESDSNDVSMVYLAIQEDALDKEFLLRANVIEGGTSPGFGSLKTRVVAFTKKSGRLYLMEASKGHAYYDDLPQQLILADFAIDEEVDGKIYFDFNQGMSDLYVQEEFYYQDFLGQDHPGFEEQFDRDSFGAGFIESMYVNKDLDQLYIRQFAQLNRSGANIPVEVRYCLEPYRPSEDFRPHISSTRKNRVAYFEAQPVISSRTGKTKIHAAKFNINKPVVFSVSANTPEEYRDAVKEGVLYWNKAFGAEVVKVIDAPDGVTAPDYTYNVIQWIDWKDAAFAYADAQIDPRTGEVLNAQVYLSSVFAVHSLQQAREIVREMLPVNPSQGPGRSGGQLKDWAKVLENSPSGPQKIRDLLRNPEGAARSEKRVSLRGFQKESTCSGQQLHNFTMAMSDLLDAKVSDSVFLKVSQDHVRMVVAHEIGHTLGLRHNFAGVTGGNYKLSERDHLFKSYLTDGATPEGTVVTNSVMDYFLLQESVMTGDQIHRGKKAFSYDEFAVGVLYHDHDQNGPENPPAMCTDSHARRYVECVPFNLNASPVAYAQWKTRNNMEQFPKMLAEYFISYAKSVDEGEDKLPLDQILYPAFSWAQKLLRPRFHALSAMEKSTRSLSIDRSFGWITEVNIEEADKKFADWVHEELATFADGDWKNVLDHLPEDFSEKVIREFDEIIASDAYRRGVGPGGHYKFSDSEISKMKAAVRKYVPELEKSVWLVDVLQLHTLSGISSEEVGTEGSELDDAVSKYLAAKAESVIFATKKSRENPEAIAASPTLMRLQVKATISETDQSIFIKKMYLVKLMLDHVKELNLFHNDGEPTKKYKPEELEAIASEVLNQKLETLMDQMEDSQVGPDGQRINHEENSASSDALKTLPADAMDVDPDAEEGQEPEPMSIEIPVSLHLPVVLPEFKHKNQLRVMAAGLLDTRKGESPAFGLRDRSELADKYTEFYGMILRGQKVSKSSLPKQTKALSVFIHENDQVVSSFSENSLLSLLLGLL